MQQIGTITGQEIKTNRNGSIAVRLLQVQLSNESDIQTVQYFNPSGEDSAPVTGDKVQVFAIGPAFKFALATEDQDNVASMSTGEKKLYSRDSGGAIAAFIEFLAGGNLYLNGSSYSAVRYEKLVTEFNELKAAFNSHVHLPSGVTPTPQSAADITSVESVTVKLK